MKIIGILALILSMSSFAQTTGAENSCKIPKCPGKRVSLVDINRNIFEGEIVARAGQYATVKWHWVNGKPADVGQIANYELKILTPIVTAEEYRGLRVKLLDINLNIFEGTILAMHGTQATVEWDRMNSLPITPASNNYAFHTLTVQCIE